MLAGLIILIPMVLLIGFTIWCVYRCRLQAMAYLRRPAHLAINVEKCDEAITSEAEDTTAESKSRLEILDNYFARGPIILSGHGGGWGLTRHLTQVRRRRQYPRPGSPTSQQEHW